MAAAGPYRSAPGIAAPQTRLGSDQQVPHARWSLSKRQRYTELPHRSGGGSTFGAFGLGAFDARFEGARVDGFGRVSAYT